MGQSQHDSDIPEFDGYHRWLGIPKHQQPPNHYRLLGITLFEHDPEVIDNAASARLIALRQQQGGPHAALCARMLNHVSQARLCLLKPQSRDAYDEQLREELDGPASHADELLPEVGDADIGINVHGTGNAVRRSSRNSQSPLGSIVGAILGGATAWWIFWQFNLLPQWVQNGVLPPPAKRKVAAEPSLQKVPDVVEKELAKSKPRRNQRPLSRRTSENPLGIEGRLIEDSSDEPQRNLTTATHRTDLIQLIDPSKDSLAGEWTLSDGQLRSPVLSYALLSLRAQFPPEYDLYLSVQRRQGSNSLSIGLPIGNAQCVVVLDGDQGSYSGLELIDGVHCRQNSTRSDGGKISASEITRVRIQVRTGNINVTIDGQPLFDWTGQAQRLSVPPEIRSVDRGRCFFLAQDSQFEISQCELVPPGVSFVEPQIAGGVSTVELLGENRELTIDGAMRRIGQEIKKTINGNGTPPQPQTGLAANSEDVTTNKPAVTNDPRVSEAISELQAAQSDFAIQSQLHFAKLTKSLQNLEQSATRTGAANLIKMIAIQSEALRDRGELPAIIPVDSLAYQRQMTNLYNRLEVAYRRAHQECLNFELAVPARTLESERLGLVQQKLESLSKMELVLNGGCENPPTDARNYGWQVFTGRWDRGTSETPPHSGEAKFYATESPHAELFQDVDVSDYATLIDRGEIQFILKAWVRSWPQQNVDTTRLIAHYLEVRKANPLGTYDSGIVASPGNWKELSDQRTLPRKTRLVRIRLQSHRNEGRSNDGYFDDVSFRIVAPAK